MIRPSRFSTCTSAITVFLRPAAQPSGGLQGCFPCADGDGQTPAQGDCDDRADTPTIKALAASKKKGAKDICNDGIDQDCDGIADNDATCDPFKDNTAPMHVVPLSFTNPPMLPDGGMVPDPSTLKPMITFPDGTVKNGSLLAGPDLFVLNLDISDFVLALTLSGAHVKLGVGNALGGAGFQRHKFAGLCQIARRIRILEIGERFDETTDGRVLVAASDETTDVAIDLGV